MNSAFVQRLMEQAGRDPKRVLFPETDEEKILRAARAVLDLGIAKPILLGMPAQVQAFAETLGVSLEGIELMDASDEALVADCVRRYMETNADFTEKTLLRKAKQPLNLGAMLVRVGDADCLAAGIRHTTGEVIMASQSLIGMQEGISTVSSLGILEIPGFNGSEGNLLSISDCAVCPNPNASELADIAIASATTMNRLLGWEPRVAMLSFSTKGSAQHESVDKVIQATALANERRPDLKIEGEFQLDAAILPQIAARKVPAGSEVAGKANIVVFPDLGAGNIGVKLVQIFAQCPAHGPLLQGFARPVTDFSRGAPVEEMLGAIAMVVVQAQAF